MCGIVESEPLVVHCFTARVDLFEARFDTIFEYASGKTYYA